MMGNDFFTTGFRKTKFFAVPTWRTINIDHWRIAIAVIIVFYIFYTGEYWREWFEELVKARQTH